MSLDVLGYDWIASLIDNQRTSNYIDSKSNIYILDDHPLKHKNQDWLNHPDLFEQIRKFRQSNLELCSPISNISSQTCIPETHLKPLNIRSTMERLLPVRSNPISTENVRKQTAISHYTLNARLFPIRTDVLSDEGEPSSNNLHQLHMLKISVPLHRFYYPPSLVEKLYTQLINFDEPQSSLNLVKRMNQSNTMSLFSHCFYPNGIKPKCNIQSF